VKRFGRVTVEGRIHLGDRYELVQKPRAQKEDFFYSRGTGPKREFDMVSPAEADSLGQILELGYSDRPTGDLHIEGPGLVTSFGIFGAPGAGKTMLLMHLLGQVLAHEPQRARKRYGALILDPKAALRDDVTRLAERAGRLDDLRIINTDDLNRAGARLNVIDCTLDPYELGAVLVLAGRSAGIAASDDYWFLEWANLFAASLSVLRIQEERDAPSPQARRPVTLRRLLAAIANEAPEPGPDGRREREIERTARLLAERAHELPAGRGNDVQHDARTLRRFFRQDYVGTVEAFIAKAFGMFSRSRLECYSDETPPTGGLPFYEDIIENGRIVLLSIAPSEPVLAKTLCTLVKCLFQRTVLARGELVSAGVLTNDERPLVMACDEYSEIASEVPGQSMGDGQFLALARQYGCMALLATQSVNVLQASSLKESWRSVFSNFAAKVYMRLVDNETAEEAVKLAGESDWKVISRGSSLGRDGTSVSRQRELRERKNLPSTVLTHALKVKQAVVIGSLDGGRNRPDTYFLQVPDAGRAPAPDPKQEERVHA
jgi:hypothetical protein